jgi:acyl-coenzyme A thioesterase PaaI-like protein
VSSGGPEALVHHELCFGCGRTNLFGLLCELERREDGSVAGRCFLKQDHQGPNPGIAHPGVVAAALVEAISLAAGQNAPARALELRFDGPASVGAFLVLEATSGAAVASSDGRPVASATASINPA